MCKPFRLAAVAPFMAVVMLVSNATPAAATDGTAVGVVAGLVRILPGINNTARPTSYNFLFTSISGVFNIGTEVLVCPSTPLAGSASSANENTHSATGTIFVWFTMRYPCLSTVVRYLSSPGLSGIFSRLATYMWAIVQGSLTIHQNGTATTTNGLVVILPASFVPTLGIGQLTGLLRRGRLGAIRRAQLAGRFIASGI